MSECAQCGNNLERMHQVFEGHYLCDHCYGAIVSGSIKEYSHKPNAEFYGESMHSLFYGLELEMMDGARPYEMAGKVGYMLPEVYTKRDASIEGGFEVVTHPCTCEYHESMEYDHIFALCEKEGYKSHDASDSCGLHIHVSRAPLNPESIGAQIYLIHKFWDKYVKFTRRKSGDINRWAGKYKHITEYMLNHEMDFTFRDLYSIASQENFGHFNRYKCINLQNNATIEYRIFRGTLKRDTLIASIQFVDILSKISMEMTEEQIRSLTWSDLKRMFDHKKELKEYLKKRGL